MSVKTVAGPFSEQQAKDTAQALGNQFSVYSVYRKDSDGYQTDERDWFVEQDDSIIADRIFGYTFGQILAKQQGVRGKI